MLNFNFENKIVIEQGILLISEPFLESDYFTRSVILLCEHNHEGSFGFVLNNFLETNFEGLPKSVLESATRISIGGPVELSNLYFIHTFGEEVPGSSELINGIYLGGDFSVLKEKLTSCNNPQNRVRYFLGYSGWDQNQLDEEIREKSWIACKPGNPSWIMDTHKDDLWERCLRSLGSKYAMFINFPINPNNN